MGGAGAEKSGGQDRLEQRLCSTVPPQSLGAGGQPELLQDTHLPKELSSVEPLSHVNILISSVCCEQQGWEAPA